MYSKLDGSRPTELIRTNSLCPPPEAVLLEHVLNNDTGKIKDIINDKLLNHIYVDFNKPILLIACIEEKVNADTVKTLIDARANLRYSDENQWEALHFAAKRSNLAVLKTIIDSLKLNDCNINTVLAQSSNALHILVRNGNSRSEDFVKCAKLLIEEGIDVNLGDSKFMSPILWAAKNNLSDIIGVILECRKTDVDLDSHKSRGQSARDIIVSKGLYEGTLPRKIDNNNHNLLLVNGDCQRELDTLFNYIKSNGANDFKSYKNGEISNLINCDNGSETLLQMACDRGNKEIVQYLVDKGADQFKTAKNEKTPIEIAADHGFYEIFKILLNNFHGKIPKNVPISLLRCYSEENFYNIDRTKCCSYLFEKLRKNEKLMDVNESDESNNSPLHYAVRYGDKSVITQLLGAGASLGSENIFGIMPIQDIESELLEKHLDNCVEFDFKGKKDKQDFSITFNYSTLIPPANIISPEKRAKNDDSENGTSQLDNRDLVQETKVISYMSTSPEFKYLLAHPVIVSFLFMKWHRIRWLFYTNLAFYIAFFLSLVIYIFSYYANFSLELSSFENFLRYFSWGVLLITFMVLMFREFFQMIILPTKYFMCFENYVEIILIILAGSILFVDSPTVNTRKQLSSLSILLAAFELILMVGQHPKLSTNVVMLKTVSYNFFKFLLWYSLLIIAFALSFYILFSKIHTKEPKNEDGEADTFADPGKSVFKTIVMLTGEFEAGELNFETFPILSKVLFVLFIFMIAIILLNLLNGLAVNDTQMIKNDATLLGHVSRAQHIHYVEVMLLGNMIPKNIFKKISNICCCLPFAQNWNYSMFKPLAEKVCLFPSLFNYEMTVYPNRFGQIYLPVNKKKKCCYGGCYNIFLDTETIKRTNELVQMRKDQLLAEQEEDRLENLEKKLDDLLIAIKRFEKN